MYVTPREHRRFVRTRLRRDMNDKFRRLYVFATLRRISPTLSLAPLDDKGQVLGRRLRLPHPILKTFFLLAAHRCPASRTERNHLKTVRRTHIRRALNDKFRSKIVGRLDFQYPSFFTQFLLPLRTASPPFSLFD